MCAENKANPNASCLSLAGAPRKAPREQPGRGTHQSPIGKWSPRTIRDRGNCRAHRDLLESLKKQAEPHCNPEISNSRKPRGRRDGRGRWWSPEAQGHSWWREGAGSGHCPAGAGAAQTDSRRCKDLPTPRIRPRPGNPCKFISIKFMRKPRPALTAASTIICLPMGREVHAEIVANDLPLTEEWAPGPVPSPMSGSFERGGRHASRGRGSQRFCRPQHLIFIQVGLYVHSFLFYFNAMVSLIEIKSTSL